MQNVKVSVKGSIATFVVDLSKKGEKSKSGKSTIIATTGGNQPIPGKSDVVFGLNVYTPN
jgi:hypothetical protein